MLDITILKTKHSGESEARKILPYVQSSDAFSLEIFNPIMTEDKLTFKEEEWAELIGSGTSRSKFSASLDNMFTSFGDPEGPAYLRKVFDYLFRNKTPLYHAERWKEYQQIKEIYDFWISGNEIISRGLELLNDGDFELGSRLYFRGGELHSRHRVMRDKNVAQNLPKAEEFLRSAYPKLASKDKIALCVQVGASHKPELYIPQETKVINLVEDREFGFWDIPEVDNMMRNNPDYKSFRLLLSKGKYKPSI